MKDERNVRNHRAAGARWRPAAILLAAVLIAVSMPFFGKSVFAADPEPVDIEKPCSLIVKSDGIAGQDGANVVVDLYRVAYLTPYPGYDTYRWELTSVLSELPDNIRPVIYNPETTDNDGWKVVTEELAKLILVGTESAPENLTQWNPSETGGLADSFTDYQSGAPVTDMKGSYRITGVALGEQVTVPSGFYLIVARGSNIGQYVSAHESADGDPAHMTSTVTLATSEKYTYQFATEMVALPTRMEGEAANTANRVPWEYDSTVVLKPEIRGRGGTLKIIKNLELYEYRKKEVGDNPRDIQDNATFVFEVTAYENEDKVARIYHNFVTINFNGDDESHTKEALVEDLPVGSYVEVKEVYSGRSYAATVDRETAVINPNEQAIVNFENTYDRTQGGGGSFVNNFKYADDTGWVGKRVKDNSDVADPEANTITNFNDQ